MNTNIAYWLMIATLGFFGYIGYKAATTKKIDADEYLSARGTQNWLKIGLSLFASGMGIWILFGPSEVGYWGGFLGCCRICCLCLNTISPSRIRGAEDSKEIAGWSYPCRLCKNANRQAYADLCGYHISNLHVHIPVCRIYSHR